jgi:hypothetical protein
LITHNIMATAAKSKTRNRQERNKPRCSLNKLGEFASESNPSRRWRIVRDQKYPPVFVTAYYSLARDAIVEYIASGEESPDILIDHLKSLQDADYPDRKWWRNRTKSCADALAGFLVDFPSALLRDGIGARPGKKNSRAAFNIEGVRVTVRPDLILEGRDGHGKPVVGAMKLHFSKRHPLSKEAGEYVATMLHRYASERLGADGVKTPPRYSKVVDVFTGEVFEAPKSFKRRREDIRHACQFIASIWERVER